ncbi:C16orf62 [Blepharisma stoltei]|uniref:Uncharacterized protein n=1 Tax=Blepharisma stoltei TaxID=1481888 RepID=A0AAU9JI29_9CILI|nr:unnamed protein product [Blepharisma stoltei]
MDINTWTIRKRNYHLETVKATIAAKPSTEHPLSGNSKKQTVEFIDPLGLNSKRKQTREDILLSPKEDPLEYWAVLSKMTSEKYQSTTGFKITTDSQENEEVKVVQHAFSRMELLEAPSKHKSNEISYVSHKEFITHIETLTRELDQAWGINDRVKTLKLAIQATKMLKDVTDPAYYPSVFITITNMLEHFGDLVYQRLMNIAFDGKTDEIFLPTQVNELARDTATNWFLKISCIRELQPRIFIEMALLKCYRFLWIDKYPEVLGRLVSQIRGIGNPMMAAYASMFLAKQAINLSMNSRQYLNDLIEDVCENLVLAPPEQYEVSTPALEWVFYCVAYGSSRDLLFQILEKLASAIEKQPDILRALIEEFPGRHITSQMSLFIDKMNSIRIPAESLKVAVALARAVYDSPQDQDSLPLLSTLWSAIERNGHTDINLYLKAADVFFQIYLKQFGPKEVNGLLDSVLALLKKNGTGRDWSGSLANIMNVLIVHSKDLSALLSLESFLSFLDEFSIQKKSEICNKIVEHYAREEIKFTVSNPLMIHALFQVTRVVHDSIDISEHSPEFVDRVSRLICRFLKNLNFGRNLEQHLSVLTDARASFINLDVVTETLVYAVLDIAMRAYRLVGGKHNLKTHAFLKACISYAHITTPSLESPVTQFKLFVLGSQVALMNGLLGEAESQIKAAISLIGELATEDNLAEIEPSLHALIGQMVILPDNPASTSGFFLPAHGLLNTLTALNKRFEKIKYRAFISMLWYLSSQAQSRLPFRLFRVDSNDKLMSGNKKFKEDMITLLGLILEELLNFVAEFGEISSPDEETIDILIKFYLALSKIFEAPEGSQVAILLIRIGNLLKDKKVSQKYLALVSN